jgi:DNA-binding CsgD family transcriptional regulator
MRRTSLRGTKARGTVVREQLDELPELRIAAQLMSIAESRTARGLGVACCSALGALTGSSTLGLYLFESDGPELVYSSDVDESLLENYKAGFWKSDPVLDCIMTSCRTTDGATLLGPQFWPHSPSFEILHQSGLAYNMGGPLICDNKIVGVLFTATRNEDAPYTPLLRQRMDILCRAGSLALTNMMNAGALEDSRTPITLRTVPALASLARSTRLPPRSAIVADSVCRGQTNKEIARQMGISDQTVKEHVANLCRRFGVQNRTELAAYLSNVLLRQ